MEETVLSHRIAIMEVPLPFSGALEEIVAVRERCAGHQTYGPQRLSGSTLFTTQCGSATLSINGREVLHRPHRVVVVAEGTQIEEITGASGWEVHYFIGRGRWSEEIHRWLGGASSHVFEGHLRLEAALNTFLDHLFTSSFSSHASGSNLPETGWQQTAHLCHLMYELQIAFQDAQLTPWMAQLQSAVENSPYIHSVDALCELTGLSAQGLRSRFLQAFGLTPSHWLREKRLQRAQLWLRTGYTVSEVGEKLGFSSAFAFSRAFKQAFGVPPSLYRKSVSQLPIARTKFPEKFPE